MKRTFETVVLWCMVVVVAVTLCVLLLIGRKPSETDFDTWYDAETDDEDPEETK